MSEDQQAPAETTQPAPKIAYEVEIDLPNLPKGELVQIPGLGTYENKGIYEVTADEADAYRVYHQRQVPMVGENDEILGSTLETGPTLLQASKNMYGVEVTTVAKQDGGGS